MIGGGDIESMDMEALRERAGLTRGEVATQLGISETSAVSYTHLTLPTSR